MYTDGLIEGRVGPGASERLGEDGMVGMINSQLARGLRGEELLEAAVARARELNGGELNDDVAVLLLGRGPETATAQATTAAGSTTSAPAPAVAPPSSPGVLPVPGRGPGAGPGALPRLPAQRPPL